MEKLHFNSGDRHLNWKIALFSIFGFWLIYVIIVTLRAYVLDFPEQEEMALRRGLVTAFGIGVTILLWQSLRRFDHRSLSFRITAAAILAIPTSLLIASANYYIFHVLTPCNCQEIGPEQATANASITVGMLIAEVAIDRYFFMIAWCAVYLTLSFASDIGKAERQAAHFARAAQSAELRALRYQVNPHFLFNTLNSLSTLVLRGRRDEAEAMIINLSTFYRTSLSGDPSEDVTLYDEIALQRLYLDIERVRFPERLIVVIDLPDTLMTAAVPGLILQPLIENAIKHGVSSTIKPVTLTISAHQVDDMLILTVSDNSPNSASQPQESGHGIGLANVRDRLFARFGAQARLETNNSADGGFTARLTLPLKQDQA